jgi:hypothetical protein
MRKYYILIGLFILAIILLLIPHLSEEEVEPRDAFFNTVQEAYIYGYPLVLMDVTLKVTTNVAEPGYIGRAPINQFSHVKTFPIPRIKDIVSPNLDTLYSIAWLDLKSEPMILELPDMNDRYYLMPILDAWTNVIESPGKRTTGTKAENFAIVGPDWNGTLPKDVHEIKSPTNKAWIIGRIQTLWRNPEDMREVSDLQKHIKLIPLSMWGQEYIPPVMPTNPEQNMNPPPEQVAAMDEETFFNQLAMLMVDNPPTPEDQAIIDKMEKVGIVAGKPFSLEEYGLVYSQVMKNAVASAKELIENHDQESWQWKNNWLLPPLLGRYDAHYLDRATVAMKGLGANLPEDSIYTSTYNDASGETLNGSKKYIIRISKDAIPPVKAFWSLTLYDNNQNLVKNELYRYALQNEQLHFNEDGSVDIYIQHDSPGKDKEENWLPAPNEDFNLILRLYWPEDNVLDWNPPLIQPY